MPRIQRPLTVFLLIFAAIGTVPAEYKQTGKVEIDMVDHITILNQSDDQDKLYDAGLYLAQSHDSADHHTLRNYLSDEGYLQRLDTDKDYRNNPDVTKLRVAGILQVLMLNTKNTPSTHDLLVSLTQTRAFNEHGHRRELLIRALVEVRPAPPRAIAFWDRYTKPEDSYLHVVIGSLLENGSTPALALFEGKILDKSYDNEDKVGWFRVDVLIHRNGIQILESCERLLVGNLEKELKSYLIDALFDFREEEWFTVAMWGKIKPPSLSQTSPAALKILKRIGGYALQNVPLSDSQKAVVKQKLVEIDGLLKTP